MRTYLLFLSSVKFATVIITVSSLCPNVGPELSMALATAVLPQKVQQSEKNTTHLRNIREKTFIYPVVEKNISKL